MICVVCSSYFAVETAKSTSMVVQTLMMQNHLICTLSTSLSYTASTDESYSCASTSTTKSTSQDSAHSKSTLDNIFQLNEDILKAMMEPEFPWDVMHHCSVFLPKETFSPSIKKTHDIYAIETKRLSPHEKWICSKTPSKHLMNLRKVTCPISYPP